MARHSQCVAPLILSAASSKCHLSMVLGRQGRISLTNAWQNLRLRCRSAPWQIRMPREASGASTMRKMRESLNKGQKARRITSGGKEWPTKLGQAGAVIPAGQPEMNCPGELGNGQLASASHTLAAPSKKAENYDTQWCQARVAEGSSARIDRLRCLSLAQPQLRRTLVSWSVANRNSKRNFRLFRRECRCRTNAKGCSPNGNRPCARSSCPPARNDTRIAGQPGKLPFRHGQRCRLAPA